MKDTKLYVLVVTLSARDNQKLSKDLKKIWKRFSKRSERSIVTKKKKNENENTANEGANAKRFKTRRYYLQKGNIVSYNVVMNGKIFYNWPIDSDIKRYKEIRELSTEKVKIILQDVY